MGQTFYQVLGVNQTADLGQLNSAYKRASIHYYQVARGTKAAEERFQHVVEAYSVLFDPEMRLAYDASLQKVIDDNAAKSQVDYALGSSEPSGTVARRQEARSPPLVIREA